MQPHDQDELRRQAQEVLKRRISMEPEARTEPPATTPPLRPRQVRSRDARPEPQRPERVDVPRERRHPALDVELMPVESVEPEYIPPEIQEPMARTERRRYTDDEPASKSDVPGRRMMGSRQARIRQSLKDREAIRQAIILNEILGKPVSLRGSEGSDTFGGI